MPASGPTDPVPLLVVADISVRYGGVAALSSVSFTVGDGEVVGLIGPNGAGKTSCIDALTGFQPIDGGHVHFRGRSLEGVPAHRRARLGFARTFQSLDLFDDLTVEENLLVAASTPGWRSTLTDALWPKRTERALLDEVVELVGLGDHSRRRPSELSNGDRHRVALARALVARPRLLLLDEPAAGLDTTESAALGELLRSLPDRGTSVLLVDHDMGLVMETCHRIEVLDFGRLVASGTPAEVRADPVVIAAYLGTAEPSDSEPSPSEPSSGEPTGAVRSAARASAVGPSTPAPSQADRPEVDG